MLGLGAIKRMHLGFAGPIRKSERLQFALGPFLVVAYRADSVQFWSGFQP